MYLTRAILIMNCLVAFPCAASPIKQTGSLLQQDIHILIRALAQIRTDNSQANLRCDELASSILTAKYINEYYSEIEKMGSNFIKAKVNNSNEIYTNLNHAIIAKIAAGFGHNDTVVISFVVDNLDNKPKIERVKCAVLGE